MAAVLAWTVAPRSGRSADRDGASLEEAEAARRQSLTTWESVSTAVGGMYPHVKGLAQYRLGELLHGTGRTEEARQQFTLAQAIMEDLAQRRPAESICHWQLICLVLEKYTQAQEAIKAGKPLFYEYLGVMAVERLRNEAEVLMGERRENAEGEGRVLSTETGRWHGLELDARYVWN